MIRKMKLQDLDAVMKIWLDSNEQAHDFVPKKYWKDHYEQVRDMLPESEVYVYEAVRFYQREDFQIRTEGVDEATGEAEYEMTWER